VHLRQVDLQQAQVKRTTFLGHCLGQGAGFARGQNALPESPVMTHALLKFLHGMGH
jgi:hypothetical protein